jgi:hypothetical protein
MKRIGKLLKLIILVVVILVIILAAGGYFFGEHLIKVGVEDGATKALSVGVTMDQLALAPFRGFVGIKGLVVKNPAGYNNEDLLEMSDGRVTVQIGSLFKDTVHIKEIKLDGINMVIEQKGLSNNLSDILNSISSGTAKTPQEAGKQGGKKLRIDTLELTNINVKVKLLPIPGKADTLTIPIPTITMADLGSDKPLNVAELSKKIIVAISDAVAKHGRDILPADMQNTMKSALGQTLGTGKAATEEGGKLLNAGKDAGAGVVGGFKGLFKPKKEE